jgi:sulfite reductase (NADPH) flavoprotein alpha-component
MNRSRFPHYWNRHGHVATFALLDAIGYALQRLDAVFSRDAGAHRYVHDALRAAATDLRDWVAPSAAIYVCGSLHGLVPGVDTVLAEVLGRLGKESLLLEGRYRRDVY